MVRGHVLPHLIGCQACRDILDEFRGLERGLQAMRVELFGASGGRAGEDASITGSVKLMAAAAILVVAVLAALFGIGSPVPSGPNSWRGEVRMLDVSAELQASDRLHLSWSPIAGAAAYAVVVRDPGGDVLARADVPADCTCEVVMPLPSAPGPPAVIWSVDALTSASVRVGTGAGAVQPRAPR